MRNWRWRCSLWAVVGQIMRTLIGLCSSSRTAVGNLVLLLAIFLLIASQETEHWLPEFWPDELRPARSSRASDVDRQDRARRRAKLISGVVLSLQRIRPGEMQISLDECSNHRLNYQSSVADCSRHLISLADLPWSRAALIRVGDSITVVAARNRGTVVSYRPAANSELAPLSKQANAQLNLKQWISLQQHSTDYPQALAIVAASVLGEKQLLGEIIKEVFRDTGTSHLLVVSGYHMSFVFGVFYSLLYFLCTRCNYLLLRISAQVPACIGALIGLTGYCLIIGSNIPAVRALFAALIIGLGKILGRRGASLRSLLLAALVVLWLFPGAIFEASFQLSFLALLGLYCAGQSSNYFWPKVDHRGLRSTDPRLKAKISQFLLRSRRNASRAFCYCFGAWWFTLPAVAIWFNQLVPLAVLINLLLVPVFSFLCIGAGGLGLLLGYSGLPGAELLFELILCCIESLFSILCWINDSCQYLGAGPWRLSVGQARVVALGVVVGSIVLLMVVICRHKTFAGIKTLNLPV